MTEGLVGYPTDGETGEQVMSMTKSEFVKRYRALLWRSYLDTLPEEQIAALAEEAGVEWAPEPTLEPTGDLSMVRVIDAAGLTWRPGSPIGWVRLGDWRTQPWSEVPQPATVLRPDGGDHA